MLEASWTVKTRYLGFLSRKRRAGWDAAYRTSGGWRTRSQRFQSFITLAARSGWTRASCARGSTDSALPSAPKALSGTDVKLQTGARGIGSLCVPPRAAYYIYTDLDCAYR